MRRFDLSVTFACFGLLGYFAWHAWEGPRGFRYQDGITGKLAALEQKFDTVKQSRLRLEYRVGLLRPESLDPDMVDELARSQLEMVKPGEIIVEIPQ